jgi:regulatory protein
MEQSPKYSLSEARMKLEALCAYQERCSYELRQRMRTWGIPAEQQHALLEYLVESNFLSDERFAEAYVSGKISIKKWGRIRITRELRLRKIPEDLIRTCFEQIPDDIYFNNLVNLAEVKWNSFRDETNQFVRKAKVMRFLQTKGYDFHEIEDCLKALLADQSC